MCCSGFEDKCAALCAQSILYVEWLIHSPSSPFPLFSSFSLLHKTKAQVEAKKEHEGAVQLLEVRSSGFPGLVQVPSGQGNLQRHHLWTFQGIWRQMGLVLFFLSSDIIASFKIYYSVRSAWSWAVGSDVCFSFSTIFLWNAIKESD